MTTVTTVDTRLFRLQSAMRARGADLVVVGPAGHLHYLLGYHAMALERLTCLLVTPSDAVMIMPDFDSAEFMSATDFTDVETWNDRGGPAAAVTAAFARLRLPDEPVTLVDEELSYRFLVSLRAGHPLQERGNAGELIDPLRLVKEKDEQARMANAGELVSLGIDAAMELAQPGMTEVELKRAIEDVLWEKGAETVDVVLVQGGPNSAAPHHQADGTPLREGQPVLIDIAASVDGYFGDITQQVYLGRPSEDYARAYDVVYAAQDAAVRAARAGATAHQISTAASGVILASEFAAWNGPSTGHGIGLDVHEPPRVVEDNHFELPAGAAITIEPGVYIPGRFGIRIEDTVLVTDSGPVRLTRGSRPLKSFEF